jgi:hypothetical protein
MPTPAQAEAIALAVTATNFDANWKPAAGSLLIGAGTNLTAFALARGLALTNDIWGNPRPASGAWDIGALYGTNTPAPPVTTSSGGYFRIFGQQ